MSDKDNMLDGFMKGLGRQLGKRRREVHQAIDRFKEEANKKDEAPLPQDSQAKTEVDDVQDDVSQEEATAHEAQA